MQSNYAYIHEAVSGKDAIGGLNTAMQFLMESANPETEIKFQGPVVGRRRMHFMAPALKTGTRLFEMDLIPIEYQMVDRKSLLIKIWERSLPRVPACDRGGLRCNKQCKMACLSVADYNLHRSERDRKFPF